MMRSLSSAVAGLRSHQTRMDVIGNNIANVNTYGFKSSRLTFSDVYYQTLSSGSSPNGGVTGGTNPTQIGYGSSVATIDVMNSVSGQVSTDRALDIYINGEGMIATKDANGNLQYSRLGILGFDAEGNLVDHNGNFVMGFPMGSDGKPAIKADGSCDIEDLTKIQVDPDVLDGLMGISISNTGEIIGTLEGDAAISLNKGKPAWLEGIDIDEDSNITGNVRVILELVSIAQSDPTSNWIDSITPAANSGVEANYAFYYDDTNGRITAVGENGETYTGTYKSGSTISLVDASGNLGFTIETNAYNTPPVTGGQAQVERIYYDAEYRMTVTGTDKGGNTVTQTLTYDLNSTTMRFNDLGITLTINPGDVETKEATQFTFDYTGVQGSLYSWIKSATLSEDSTIAIGDLYIEAGKGYSASLTNAFSALGLMNGSAVAEMLEDLGITGNVTIKATVAGNSFTYSIEDSDGVLATSNAISGNNQPIIFNRDASHPNASTAVSTWNVGTYNKATYSHDTSLGAYDSDVTTGLNNLMAALGEDTYQLDHDGTNWVLLDGAGSAVSGATVALVGDEFQATIGGNTYVIAKDTSPSSVSTTGGPYDLTTITLDPNITNSSGNYEMSLGSVSAANKIYLVDNNGNRVADATWSTGSSSVTLGDLRLIVDSQELYDFFNPSTGKAPDASANRIKIGDVDRGDVKNWKYDNNAASSSTGVGESFTIGQIAVAKIPNMAAMEQIGDSYFATSFNSGDATFWKPGISGTGELVAGYLEMSNVDISKEFTDMITTQRGFQANTRIITVSDEMLQELVNLKR